MAPAAGIYGGQWLGLAILAALCAALSATVQGLCPEQPHGPLLLAAVQWLWLGVLLGSFAGQTANCWEGDQVFPLIPLVLLALSAFAAKNGAERASRVGGILIWLVGAFFAVALLAGIGGLKPRQVEMSLSFPNPGVVPVLLLPCTAALLPRSGRSHHILNSVSIALLPVLFTLWLQAALSPEICAEAADQFYEYSKSISIFGTVERLESLVACGITASWVALFALLLSAAGCQAERVNPGRGGAGVWGAAAVAAVWLLADVPLDGPTTAIISLLLWAVLPIVSTVLKKIKKSA